MGALSLLAAGYFYFFGVSSRGGAVRKRGVAAQGAVELLLWCVFFYSWGGQIKSGAEHRRTEGKHRRNYFFSGVSGYYFCVGVVLVDGGVKLTAPLGRFLSLSQLYSTIFLLKLSNLVCWR